MSVLLVTYNTERVRVSEPVQSGTTGARVPAYPIITFITYNTTCIFVHTTLNNAMYMKILNVLNIDMMSSLEM